ncbi:hypothetical protein ACH5RR_037985 [Cinchona calisaya]|uniref:Uncharacterized protein n=1 Tax=Cinchona calisaya TaxID=153742 RepID=A0ABD2Y935_9GENT
MEFEFRHRDYTAEEKAYSLPRLPAESHPLSKSSHQVDLGHKEKDETDILDPLREVNEKKEATLEVFQDEEINLTGAQGPSSEDPLELHSKEWTSFKKILMQRFPVSKRISLSSISNAIMKTVKVKDKSPVDTHLEELDDPQKFTEEGLKVISQKEYVARLHELKDEISHSWRNNDRVTSLKLSIKVARLLMDTSVVEFYPTLFVLAVDVMDMLGDLVWERIRQKAEYSEDGTFICSLPENFEASNICDRAKETCNNWFSKIGSIRELLPRIYLEVAILPCWCFLINNPLSSLQRLVMMTRGIADPLASAYCQLYMVHRAQKLRQHDVGYLITGINDLKILMMRILSMPETTRKISLADGRLLVSLMEPPIEYMMRCIFKDLNQVSDILMGLGLGKDRSHLFGDRPCISIILHHLLKELPTGVICSNAVDILHLIECNFDFSYDQFLNYKLLGHRLCESVSQVNEANALVDKVIQVISCYDSLYEYLEVLDAYVDIGLQNQMDIHLNSILNEIFERVCAKEIDESALSGLQSFLLKLLTHFDDLKDILSMNRFVDILDVMHGSSRNLINLSILRMATRNSCIQDPTIIHFLFEVSQALHDGTDFSNIRNDENQHSALLISRFVNMVDYGLDFERKLSFLVDCRGAFGGLSELKETLVHSSNILTIKALKDGSNHITFAKSCLTFSEVTIPAIPSGLKQLNLYIETAEVALLGGLISHADGLVESALCYLQDFDLVDGLRVPDSIEASLSLICKLCSLMILLPGNLEQGFLYGPKKIFSFLDSQSWMTSKLKIRVLSALISMSAALSQNVIPFQLIHGKVIGSKKLIFGDPTCLEEFLSFSGAIVQKIVDIVLQEPSQASRGNLALEGCNSIASSFKVCPEVLTICSKLVEIAELSLSSDNRYLVSTKNFLKTRQLCFREDGHRHKYMTG